MGFYSSDEWFHTNAMHPGGTNTTNWLINHGNLQTGDRVLDLCCGRGDGILVLLKRGIDPVGVDCDEAVIAKVKQQIPKAELLLCNAWDIPGSASCFRAVLCECSLTLMEHRIGEVVKEIVRVLEPGGLLLLADLYAKVDHLGISSKEGWTNMLWESGLELVEWQDETAALQQYVLQYLWEKGCPFPMCSLGGAGHVKLKDVGYFVGIWRKTYG